MTTSAPTAHHHRTGSGRGRQVTSTWVRYALLALFLVLLAGPLLWQLSLSFKGAGDNLYAQPPQLLPHHPTGANYTEVTRRLPILRYVLNSAIVSACVVVGNMVGASLAGYALARLRFRGRRIVTGLFVAGLLIPIETVLIAQFLLVRSAQLSDTLLGVALPTIVTPLNVLLMRNGFLGLPKELEEAAVVDGANVWQRFLFVCLPQMKGTLTVVAIFAFVGSWNDFLWPLIILSNQDHYTLTVGLSQLRGTFFSDPRIIAAGTIVALVPIIAFFMALQRYFFRGMESGGLKA